MQHIFFSLLWLEHGKKNIKGRYYMYLIGDGACITNIKGIARETEAVSAVGLYALATGVLGVNIVLWCDYLGGGCSDNKLFNLYQSIVTWESECTFAGISPSTQIKDLNQSGLLVNFVSVCHPDCSNCEEELPRKPFQPTDNQ